MAVLCWRPLRRRTAFSSLAISRFDCPQFYMRELGMEWCRGVCDRQILRPRFVSPDSVNTKSSHDVTQLLLKWTQGDEAALEQLMPLVYEELRRMARQHLRRERVGHTMQTSTLVHEAYLRLIDAGRVQWQD